MKKTNKIKLFGAIAIGGAALMLTGCTQTFCSSTDLANIAYPYEQGVTVYCDKTDIPNDYKDVAFKVFDDNDTLYAYIPVDKDGNFTSKKSTYLVNSIINVAKGSNYNYTIPSQLFFEKIDQKVLEKAISTAVSEKYEVNGKTVTGTANLTAKDINAFTVNDSDGESNSDAEINLGILREYGYVKFLGENEQGQRVFWTNWNTWLSEIRAEIGYELCPTTEFVNFYQSTVYTKISSFRTCVATRDGKYGHFGSQSNWEVNIQAKSYGDAWGKGFLEGLLVYPVAWMVDTFAYGIDPALSGFGQIISIICVTLIVRVALTLLTLKGTLDQQKMQALQPELAKIQAKYPNSNTNASQRSRMTQEQSALYKRNKINPFSSIVILIIQFPVFISVWSALSGSSALSSGSFLNLRLSDTIKDVVFNFSGAWWTNETGWWTAVVLFLLMVLFQTMSMLLPQMINKRRQKNMPKLNKNPAQDKMSKQMKYISWGMLIFTIIMGFLLPSAMGVYWGIGALISMCQTIITQAVMAKKTKKAK